MNKAERGELRIIFAEALTYSNFVKAQKLLDYVDTLEAARRFVVGCDCTVCKDNREALDKGK